MRYMPKTSTNCPRKLRVAWKYALPSPTTTSVKAYRSGYVALPADGVRAHRISTRTATTTKVSDDHAFAGCLMPSLLIASQKHESGMQLAARISEVKESLFPRSRLQNLEVCVREVAVERQRPGNSLAPHHLEAHGVGERKSLVGKPPDPARDSALDQLGVERHDDVRTSLEYGFEKQRPRARATPAQDECVHLRRDERRGNQQLAAAHSIGVGVSSRFVPLLSG